MIQIHNKQDCSGCHACFSGCPKSCITMKEDEEGFLYPFIDEDACIQCGLCKKNCVFITPKEQEDIPSIEPMATAAQCRDPHLLSSSSSGGVFSLLANQIIEEGGIVFGAQWKKDWKVVHAWSDTKQGIEAFRGSKYLQSEIGDAFKQTKTFLKNGRQVLFSGTPCQIAGLQRYLRTPKPNLFCVEIACHGVPSPKVWQAYLKNYLADHHITHPCHISFRHKTHHIFLGNDSSSLGIFHRQETKLKTKTESLYATAYGHAFMQNIISRPSCHDCKVKQYSSMADISLGDFQGLGVLYPSLTPKNGVSLVICHTEKGKQLYHKLKDALSMNMLVPPRITISRNAGLSYHPQPLERRNSFMKSLMQTETERDLAKKLLTTSTPGLAKRVMHYISKSRTVILKNFMTKILKHKK